jgi:hypothetical protein
MMKLSMKRDRKAKQIVDEMKKAIPVALSTAQLKALCDQAEALGFATGPNLRFWKDVDPSGFHVAGQWFRHRPCLAMWKGVKHSFNFDHNGGVNIRALVLCKMKGKIEPHLLLCDFDEKQFVALCNKRA